MQNYKIDSIKQVSINQVLLFKNQIIFYALLYEFESENSC